MEIKPIKLSLYTQIMDEIRIVNRRTLSKSIMLKFSNVSPKTLKCILTQDYQRKMKESHAQHCDEETKMEYYTKYVNGKEANEPLGFLSRIADEVDYAPSLMAKLVLKQHLTNKNGKPPSRKQLSTLINDPAQIDCPVLSTEIHLCTIDDEHYGPIKSANSQYIINDVAVTIKPNQFAISETKTTSNLLGEDYEERLKKQLHDMKISFIGAKLDEKVMRAKGYPKTPDVKLNAPIAINGKAINWIESKALFGDIESHEAYLANQLWSYWNRFGPGMVIYWFGFIEEIDKHENKGMLVRCDFPSEFTWINPSKTNTQENSQQ